MLKLAPENGFIDTDKEVFDVELERVAVGFVVVGDPSVKLLEPV